MKIELKKISFNERMSEETNCFVADLYINGKKVGYCENRGTGGPTDYHGDTSSKFGYTDVNIKLIKEAEAYFKSLPKAMYVEHNFEYQPTLENAIDEQFEEFLKVREDKKKAKMYEKALCFGVPNGNSYRTISWKGRTLAQIDKVSLQRAYDKAKADLKAGEVILNTNIKELGLV